MSTKDQDDLLNKYEQALKEIRHLCYNPGVYEYCKVMEIFELCGKVLSPRLTLLGELRARTK